MVDMIVKDIKYYLNSDNGKFLTMQYIVGTEMIFKGWVMKNQINTNQAPPNSIQKLNQIIV